HPYAGRRTERWQARAAEAIATRAADRIQTWQQLVLRDFELHAPAYHVELSRQQLRTLLKRVREAALEVEFFMRGRWDVARLYQQQGAAALAPKVDHGAQVVARDDLRVVC